MKSREETEAEFFANFEERARDLHNKLVNNEVPARKIPQAIFELRDLYRTAIFHDQRIIQSKNISYSCGDETKSSTIMAQILNAFVHRNLHEKDYADLKSLASVEADRLRNYLRFENETIQYVRFIRDYMIKLKREIIGERPGESEVASFYGDGHYPNGVDKILKVLKNIEHNNIPVDLIRRFEKVFCLFENIKPSKHRPLKATEFYNSKLAELYTFSFTQEKSQENIVDLRVTMTRAVQDL
ncbi:MAG TPA: hypothetical protein VL360_09330 [Gammaproteobacteria bacterium]|jgi:hypothetical protein|nr:hypothetical protein [Gammaproteobacteria bacterium]